MGFKSRPRKPVEGVTLGELTPIHDPGWMLSFLNLIDDREHMENIDSQSPLYYLLRAATICDVFLVDLCAGDIVVQIDNASQSFESKIGDVLASDWFPEVRRVKMEMSARGHTLAGCFNGVAFAASLDGRYASTARKVFDVAVGLR
jgi:hypothetical protein